MQEPYWTTYWGDSEFYPSAPKKEKVAEDLATYKRVLRRSFISAVVWPVYWSINYDVLVDAALLKTM